MSIPKRVAVGALSLSALAFIGLTSEEGFTDKAVIPTRGDRPTVGLGSTYRDDGTPVRMGDTITVPQAIKRSYSHITKDESRLRQCVTAPLSQVEYDTLVNFSYQYGVAATCASGMVRHANAGRYAQACGVYLEYRYSAGYDCSTPGNKVCSGVWARSQARYAACLEAQ